jgi:hypothetical protein
MVRIFPIDFQVSCYLSLSSHSAATPAKLELSSTQGRNSTLPSCNWEGLAPNPPNPPAEYLEYSNSQK